MTLCVLQSVREILLPLETPNWVAAPCSLGKAKHSSVLLDKSHTHARAETLMKFYYISHYWVPGTEPSLSVLAEKGLHLRRGEKRRGAERRGWQRIIQINRMWSSAWLLLLFQELLQWRVISSKYRRNTVAQKQLIPPQKNQQTPVLKLMFKGKDFCVRKPM